jgi:hypothetical protein
VTLIDERKVDDIEVDGVTHPWVYEQLTKGLNGVGTIKFIGGTVGELVFVVQASERAGTGWPWQDVIEVAQAQSGKLRQLPSQKPEA